MLVAEVVKGLLIFGLLVVSPYWKSAKLMLDVFTSDTHSEVSTELTNGTTPS